MKNINLGQKEIIHFIGIGGIGMSGLAQIMKVMGFNVQGSDLIKNKNVENCKKLGIKFFTGHKKDRLERKGKSRKGKQSAAAAAFYWLLGIHRY